VLGCTVILFFFKQSVLAKFGQTLLNGVLKMLGMKNSQFYIDALPHSRNDNNAASSYC